ncbi:MAG: hypothetical protein A4E66_01688 [Syntrophus sp. PtaB.Bin001]|nr:MAG: hypothetical protein A4E66_01688 [Syntrophus sp. PtaB.Bin001]
MLLNAVIGDSPFQVGMQGQCVQMILKDIMLVHHDGFQGLRQIGFRFGSQEVGLPVRKIVTAFGNKDEVDEASQPATDGIEGETSHFLLPLFGNASVIFPRQIPEKGRQLFPGKLL